MYTVINHHLWNPKVHCTFTTVQHLFLFCAGLIRSVSSDIIFKVHFNIILNYMPWYPKWSLVFAISARTLWVFALCILLRVYFSCHVLYIQTELSPWNRYFKWILVASRKLNRHHKFFWQVPELCKKFRCSLPVDLKFWRILHQSRILWHT